METLTVQGMTYDPALSGDNRNVYTIDLDPASLCFVEEVHHDDSRYIEFRALAPYPGSIHVTRGRNGKVRMGGSSWRCDDDYETTVMMEALRIATRIRMAYQEMDFPD